MFKSIVHSHSSECHFYSTHSISPIIEHYSYGMLHRFNGLCSKLIAWSVVGKCGRDGYYTVGTTAFIQCSAGRPYYQMCANGSQNRWVRTVLHCICACVCTEHMSNCVSLYLCTGHLVDICICHWVMEWQWICIQLIVHTSLWSCACHWRYLFGCMYASVRERINSNCHLFFSSFITL